MPQVTLRIGGQSYEVACRAGEEQHFRELGEIVDEKVAQAVTALGGLGETRRLLFAALLLADELSAARAEPADDVAAMAVEELADRLEALAARLEGAADAP